MSGAQFELTIEGSSFLLLPERAVFWIDEKVLICSDLHWGRELFLQKHGMPIPELVVYEERNVLENLIEKLRPVEWWILGDFIHHPEGLPDAFWQQLKSWCEDLLEKSPSLTSIHLVPGNHDRSYPRWTVSLPIAVDAKGIERGAFFFAHEPGKKNKPHPKFAWYGHLHPAVTLPLMGQKKLPCFWIRKHEAYLPAFSRLAGGQEIDPDCAKDRVIAIGEGHSFEWIRKTENKKSPKG
jgi:DNA ligase-associated metallophosphoesterase